MIAKNIDVAIRVGDFDGTNLRMTKIAEMNIPLCAARDWVDQNPIESPEDLAQQNWVGLMQTFKGRQLKLRHASGIEKTVELSSVLKVNGGGAAKRADPE